MPTRILRDGILSSPRINQLSLGAEVLYRRLMSVADDYGRFYASTATIRGACWPTSLHPPCEQDVDKWLTECQQGVRPLLTTYEHSGCWFIQISDFNQKTRSKSKFPEPVRNLSTSCPQVEDKMPALVGDVVGDGDECEDGGRAGVVRAVPVPDRFAEWLKPWPRCASPDAAAQAWISVVVSRGDEDGAFSARDRYLSSDEVFRGAITEPAKWLFAQSRARWAGVWPVARKNGNGQSTEELAASIEAFRRTR